MIKKIIVLLFCFTLILGQKKSPASYWDSLEMKEKVAFINGVYATGAKLKYHHKQEINKQGSVSSTFPCTQEDSSCVGMNQYC